MNTAVAAQVTESYSADSQLDPFVESLSAERPRIVEWLSGWLGSRADAEDIAQDALLRAYLRRADLHDPSRSAPWLRRIAHNLAVDMLRKRGDELRMRREWGHLFECEQACVDDARDPQDGARVFDGLKALRPTYREVLRLVDLDGKAITEVARREATTPNNVRVRLHRARRALRARLEPGLGSRFPKPRTSTRSPYVCSTVAHLEQNLSCVPAGSTHPGQ